MTDTEEISQNSKESPSVMIWVGGWYKVTDSRGKEKWIIIFIDSHSRYIVSSGIYYSATAEYALDVLIRGMETYGIPRAIVTNNKAPFTSPPAPSDDDYLFDRFLAECHIYHFHRPEMQRRLTTLWRNLARHGGYFKSLKDYVRWFNEDCPNAALDYAFPCEVFQNHLQTSSAVSNQTSNPENTTAHKRDFR